MKPLFYTKTLIAMAVAIAAAAASVSQAQEQPIPPPATADNALPANIIPGSPLAEVVKMLQAGVAASTIKSYVLNSQSAFNLDADKILFLKDEGAPSDLINAMMDRDKALYAASVTPPPTPAPPAPVDTGGTDTSAPSTDSGPPPDMTVTDFNDSLSPYGAWVDVDGYGRCWRPTVEIYDPGWSPYCDRGHWTYTDYGWYWDSDYAWGSTFHYGRWFRNGGLGWCWYPDTVWAPSWVVWRSDSENYGWAPLPPFADFRPGVGFFYRGASVAVDFDFGLGADAFIFVSPDHFFDRHPRNFVVSRDRAFEVFHHSTVVNNFDVHGRVMVNRGFAAERMASVTHHVVQPVHISALPNAGRQGWHGDAPVNVHSGGHAYVPDNHNDAVRHSPEVYHGPVNSPVNHEAEYHAPAPQPARPTYSASEPAHVAPSQNQPYHAPFESAQHVAPAVPHEPAYNPPPRPEPRPEPAAPAPAPAEHPQPAQPAQPAHSSGNGGSNNGNKKPNQN